MELMQKMQTMQTMQTPLLILPPRLARNASPQDHCPHLNVPDSPELYNEDSN
jgi:hypothetical protein